MLSEDQQLQSAVGGLWQQITKPRKRVVAAVSLLFAAGAVVDFVGAMVDSMFLVILSMIVVAIAFEIL